MSQLINSRFVKRDAEIIRVTEQQFEECRKANEKGVDYLLEPKEGSHLIVKIVAFLSSVHFAEADVMK